MHMHNYYYYSVQPFTMWQDFKGSVYWDELAETRDEIFGMAGF